MWWHINNEEILAPKILRQELYIDGHNQKSVFQEQSGKHFIAFKVVFLGEFPIAVYTVNYQTSQSIT